jgi:hypothetical protein
LNPISIRAAIVAALAAFGFVTAAQAEPGRGPVTYFQAGIGGGLAATYLSEENQGTVAVMAGYRFNPYVGVQAVGFQVPTVAHQPSTPGAPYYDFERFWGVQLVGFIPCTPYWDLFGEVGAGQAHLTSATPGAGTQDKTDGLTGAGIRWQLTDHFAMSLDVTRLWDTRVTNGTLRAEVNF